MTSKSKDVVGIGNAIVDILTHVEDDFLQKHGMVKGTMALIDDAEAHRIYDDMGPAQENSGGSAANTIAGIASLGGEAGFLGRVGDDQLGEVFAHDIRSLGIDFPDRVARASKTPESGTGRCYVLISPDAQRTMNTFLGASAGFGPDDLDAGLIQSANITYLEGYLFDPPKAKEAFYKAADIAHGSGGKVALTLSDPFCVERHREEFRDLVSGHIDILFANELEIISLFECETFDEAADAIRNHTDIAVLTRSEQGAVILSDGEAHMIDIVPVNQLVDSTGAGDLYAAGFLYGLTHGHGLAESGHMGAIAAAEIISHVGARPAISLKQLLSEHMPL